MSACRRLVVVAAALVIPAAFAAAPTPNIEKGKAAFTAQCSICHATSREPGPTQGPNLAGVVGRKAASAAGFPTYTRALKASKLTWTTKNLDEFLRNPQVKVPGTLMPVFLPDNAVRADVIAYLATLKM